VALSSTVFTFEIDLADANRGVYESLALKLARHPSEADEFLVARVLAYCLEYTPGIEFSRGLSDADDPPVAVRDPTGVMHVWIDIGTPSADRLHRAAKAVPRVAVYVHKDPRQWLDGLGGARIHRRDALEIYAIDRAFISTLVGRLDRRLSFALSISDADLAVSFDNDTVTGSMRRLAC
jgi:uncharacterized protein YaeQ